MLSFRLLTVRHSSLRIPCSFLFTPRSLGLDSFLDFCKRRRSRSCDPLEEFWKKMADCSRSELNGLIFTEDIKDALAFSETSEQLKTTTELCWRYRAESEKVGLMVFAFGPTLIRLHHKLKCPTEAVETFRKGRGTQDFNFLSSYTILMDLLFECGHYEEVLECWEHYCTSSELADRIPCPRSLQILFLGACYKLGCEASLSYGMKFVAYCQERQICVERKGVVFLVGLAMKLVRTNNFRLAFEILSLIREPETYVAGRSVLLFLLARLGRILDAIKLLEQLTLSDLPITDFQDREVAIDSVTALKESVEKSNNADWITKFRRLEKILREGGHLTAANLDSLISAPVASSPSEPEILELSLSEQKLLSQREDTEKQLGSVVYADDRKDLSKNNTLKQELAESVAAHVRSQGPFEVETDEDYQTVNQ